MECQRDGLVSITEAFSGLDGRDAGGEQGSIWDGNAG